MFTDEIKCKIIKLQGGLNWAKLINELRAYYDQPARSTMVPGWVALINRVRTIINQAEQRYHLTGSKAETMQADGLFFRWLLVFTAIRLSCLADYYQYLRQAGCPPIQPKKVEANFISTLIKSIEDIFQRMVSHLQYSVIKNSSDEIIHNVRLALLGETAALLRPAEAQLPGNMPADLTVKDKWYTLLKQDVYRTDPIILSEFKLKIDNLIGQIEQIPKAKPNNPQYLTGAIAGSEADKRNKLMIEKCIYLLLCINLKEKGKDRPHRITPRSKLVNCLLTLVFDHLNKYDFNFNVLAAPAKAIKQTDLSKRLAAAVASNPELLPRLQGVPMAGSPTPPLS